MSPYSKGMRFPDDDNEGEPKMSVLATGQFWAATAERALKTFCQGILAVIGVGVFTPADVDWKQVLLGAGIAAGASVLTSIVSSGVGTSGPGLGNAEELTPPVE